MKLGRNDLCWCKSGKKYKNCHMAFDERISDFDRQGHMVPPRDIIKTPQQIEGMRQAGVINTGLLDLLEEKICEGMSTQKIDDIVRDYTKEHDAICATLNYEGYPKNCCTSINEVVCHGIPDPDRILKSGDILNVDVTTIYKGYYADASRMFCIGKVPDRWKELVDVTKECLELGVAAVKPWESFIGDIGEVVSKHAYEHGFSVVREIGGHGTGIEFHEEPYVCHVGKKGTDMLIVPGMTFTIEPMINLGTAEVFQDAEDGWTIYTDDGQPSAQWEYTLAVTEDGVEILTH